MQPRSKEPAKTVTVADNVSGALSSPEGVVLYLAARRPLHAPDALLLSREEGNRAASFRSVRDRELFVLGRVMLRSILAAHLGGDRAAVPIRIAENGRPEFDSEEETLKFSLSHSVNRVALAVAPYGRIGIDIEHHEASDDFHQIACHCFHPREATMLEQSGDRAEELFYKIWSLREACLKAADLSWEKAAALDFSQAATMSIAADHCVSDVGGLVVRALPVDTGYSLSVAADWLPPDLSIRRWHWEESLADQIG